MHLMVSANPNAPFLFKLETYYCPLRWANQRTKHPNAHTGRPFSILPQISLLPAPPGSPVTQSPYTLPVSAGKGS